MPMATMKPTPAALKPRSSLVAPVRTSPGSTGVIIWRLGSFAAETYEISVDIDHLVCTAGDLVKVSHDVPLWGGGWGRVKEITYDANGDVIGITLDDMVQMVGGATAAFSTTRLAPISDRNVILQSDRKAQWLARCSP